MGAAEVADTTRKFAIDGLFGTPLTINGLPQWGVLCLLVLAFMRGWLPWRKADDARDASLRADFMTMRAEDRQEHANEITAIRKEQMEERRTCDDKLHAMQAQIDGLMRQIITMQLASGKPISLTPASDDAASRLVARLNGEPGVNGGGK